MSEEEEQQQIIEKYLFKIRPLEIKSNSKIKSSSRKSVLIKLGNNTAKCTELNTCVELEIDVLYSKTLLKYCPIKGIIKIYDVAEDGSEIISCVGGFQTDELLNQAQNRLVLDKEIGTSKLTMEIEIIRRNNPVPTPNLPPKLNNQNRAPIASKKSPENSAKVDSPKPSNTSLFAQPGSLSSSNSEKDSLKRLSNPLLKLDGPKNFEIPFKNTSNSINKSLQKINQALSFKRFEQSGITSRANEVLAKAEVESLKQQLQEEKRRVGQLENRLNRSDQSLSSAKSQLSYFHLQIQQYHQLFSRFIDCIQLADGNPVSTVDSPSKLYSLKYSNEEVDKAFQDFFRCIGRKVKQQLPPIDLDHETIQMSRNKHEIEQSRRELAILKKLASEKDKKILSLERQIEGTELTIRNLKETNRHLTEENQYFRQQNDQLEIRLYHKENAIDSLNAKNQQLTEDLHQSENKLYNSNLEIEELKEEVSNCSETIEKYREKYGDLKNVKNRAIEMEIRDCLRWIQLQNRDLEMSEIEQTTPSEHEHEEDRGDSLSSVIRNIEIEKVPRQQMAIIRGQLLRILEKVDELMAK